MSDDQPKLLQEFKAYCDDEREQRMNSGGQFDAELYDEAVELVMRQLSNQLGSDAE